MCFLTHFNFCDNWHKTILVRLFLCFLFCYWSQIICRIAKTLLWSLKAGISNSVSETLTLQVPTVQSQSWRGQIHCWPSRAALWYQKLLFSETLRLVLNSQATYSPPLTDTFVPYLTRLVSLVISFILFKIKLINSSFISVGITPS